MPLYLLSHKWLSGKLYSRRVSLHHDFIRYALSLRTELSYVRKTIEILSRLWFFLTAWPLKENSVGVSSFNVCSSASSDRAEPRDLLRHDRCSFVCCYQPVIVCVCVVEDHSVIAGKMQHVLMFWLKWFGIYQGFPRWAAGITYSVNINPEIFSESWVFTNRQHCNIHRIMLWIPLQVILYRIETHPITRSHTHVCAKFIRACAKAIKCILLLHLLIK